ncbi:NmrA-like family domain-containing protein 1 [Colletotrichum orbiculare MAFF 240422]|uniref:NmrA-like family domain-containing protein 1 n=1 Tax=Colletotrichum orbiculare (strain 104-T / ATCC 96160 / CBS 514.97 / LARS 414 / MAFF 240422) TaxID=1213857 RepID=N4VB27_COLOR|nr:NmrA-like family domain-containing protein 1 [Colletotrichum orbiculare MAFF 240422]
MSSTQQKKAILVTGATGKQGGAVISALLDAGADRSYDIVAVTRNPASAPARKLEASGVKLVQGDLDDVPAVFSSARSLLGPDTKIWGVYSVQRAIGKGASAESEQRQGLAVVDEALASNVSHIVYSSIDRGGDASYDVVSPTVRHFQSKHRIEHHLVDGCKGTTTRWTILRPVAFMDNMAPGLETKIMATSWRVAVREKPLQLVAVRDIGRAAARAFLHPDEFAGREVPLAGDELTLEQANAVFRAKVGTEIPETFQFFVRFLHWMIAEFGAMYAWFYTDGFRVDVAKSRRDNGGLLTFAEWIERESQYGSR